ncbi:MAG TPA: peptidylprolyl isomerase [Micromonosporaceae bacterium]|nr:peptidylprolyl isomerase [Micromonosporaceae bacterium]
MASSKRRQRKLARAKLDRQMARRAATQRRKRQIQAGVGATLVLALIVLGSIWALGGFDSDPKPAAEPPDCVWTPQDAAVNVHLKEVGKPAETDLPTSGIRPMTISTNQGGPVTVELDLENAPCAGASLAHLAGQGFFDNTTCHEITAEGALRCGDPSGTGQGGPTYSFYRENLPALPAPLPSGATPSPSPDQPPAYPAGTVAMIGDPTGSLASQFLIFFEDFTPAESPQYSVVGRVTAGLDVVKKIGALETVDNGSGEKVKPKTDVVIQSLTIGEVGAAPVTDPSAEASATPATQS